HGACPEEWGGRRVGLLDFRGGGRCPGANAVPPLQKSRDSGAFEWAPVRVQRGDRSGPMSAAFAQENSGPLSAYASAGKVQRRPSSRPTPSPTSEGPPRRKRPRLTVAFTHLPSRTRANAEFDRSCACEYGTADSDIELTVLSSGGGTSYPDAPSRAKTEKSGVASLGLSLMPPNYAFRGRDAKPGTCHGFRLAFTVQGYGLGRFGKKVASYVWSRYASRHARLTPSIREIHTTRRCESCGSDAVEPNLEQAPRPLAQVLREERSRGQKSIKIKRQASREGKLPETWVRFALRASTPGQIHMLGSGVSNLGSR
ncbi:hypothetical protein THAOC_37709, partial [Thalassiosira oceanica]